MISTVTNVICTCGYPDNLSRVTPSTGTYCRSFSLHITYGIDSYVANTRFIACRSHISAIGNEHPRYALKTQLKNRKTNNQPPPGTPMICITWDSPWSNPGLTMVDTVVDCGTSHGHPTERHIASFMHTSWMNSWNTPRLTMVCVKDRPMVDTMASS